MSINPASYTKFVDPNGYMQMMNPASYVQFMNSASYMPQITPETDDNAIETPKE